MPSIQVNEEDQAALVCAAMDAEAKGDSAQAATLDKLARRANLTITRASIHPHMRSRTPDGLTWRNMPTCLRTDPHL